MMKASTSALWSLPALLLLLSACAVPVKTEYDRQFAFEGYERFAWQNPVRDSVQDPSLDSELMDRRVQLNVKETLEAKGYRSVAAEEADFIVTYHVVSRRGLSGGGSRVSIGMGRGMGSTSVGGGVTLGGSRPQQQSMIILDVIDAERDELVWRGWRETDTRQDRYDNRALRRLVGQILEHFPPES